MVKCKGEDVVEIVRSAVAGGKAISKKELVDELVRRCGYRDESGAYRLIKRLEEKGVLKYLPGHGYIVPSEALSGHDKQIMRTLALILDMAHARDFRAESLEKLMDKRYVEKMPIPVARRLMAEAILHIATRSGDLAEELKKASGLLDRYDKLFKEWAYRNTMRARISMEMSRYNKESYVRAVKAVLGLGEEADANRYYDAVMDLIRRIVGESNMREACYGEADRFGEDAKILRRFCDNAAYLDLLPTPLAYRLMWEEHTSKIAGIEKELGEVATLLGRIYRRLVNAAISFYIDADATGRLSGWCRLCGGRVDDELVQSIEKMISWLGKRAPEEISYMLERWEPSMLVTLIMEKVSEEREEMLKEMERKELLR
ncbi:MAG: hypothetical protein RQ885_04555 [Desulfurococcales archaeon]|jgi:hypothetical protein|nr:hypothetical protein [Desulfurococcales archaeon]